MGIKSAIFAGLGLALVAALPASAMDAKIYSYHARANYCPAGLQPIQIDGVICCGSPNQHISYNQALAHPVAKKKIHKVVHHRPARKLVCPVGEKGGCFYQ